MHSQRPNPPSPPYQGGRGTAPLSGGKRDRPLIRGEVQVRLRFSESSLTGGVQGDFGHFVTVRVIDDVYLFV